MNVYNRFKTDLAIGLLIFLFISSMLELFEIGYDSTDGTTRSGMSLHIDSMTGCHYLAGSRGGLTPRLTSSGKHFCG